MFALAFTGANGDVRHLEYKVEENSLAEWWYAALKKLTLSDLRSTHTAMSGFDVDLTPHIQRLNELIGLLNEFVSPKITTKFDADHPRESLNALHIHFPTTHRVNQDDLVCEYNDVIHFIEDVYVRRGARITNERVMLCFQERDRRKIELEEFKHFTIRRRFGDCFAHYPHVGRHPLEVYFANDVTIPDDQIIPMSDVTASASFRFGTDMYVAGGMLPLGHLRISQFFDTFGKHRLPYAYDDPRLALGYPLVACLATPVPDKASLRDWLGKATLTDIIH